MIVIKGVEWWRWKQWLKLSGEDDGQQCSTATSPWPQPISAACQLPEEDGAQYDDDDHDVDDDYDGEDDDGGDDDDGESPFMTQPIWIEIITKMLMMLYYINYNETGETEPILFL